LVARWDAAQVAVPQSVAVSIEADDLGVVHEAVDHRGGDDVVAEDLAPAIWGWLMFVRAGCA
jgi:hypothetical protein